MSSLIFLSSLCSADSLTYLYSPSAGVKGDIAEDDLIEDDDFTSLTIEPGVFRAVRWDGGFESPLYIEYSSISTEDASGNFEKDKYQSFSLGFVKTEIEKQNHFVDSYWNLGGGVGFARFNFDEVKAHALGEASLGLGLIIAKYINLGLFFKYQIIGYPSETIAQSGAAGFSIGINYY